MTNYCALKTYGEIHGELLDGPRYDSGGKALMGGKGAKGRRSVLNVTQPRRKAKLQLVQSTAPSLHLTVVVSRCIIASHMISRRRRRVKG